MKKITLFFLTCSFILALAMACTPVQPDPISHINPASPTGPDLTISANIVQHPIDPHIYGMNFASQQLAADIRLPLNRWGGNATTRYNWQNDTSNHASDWYFENIPEDNPAPQNLPNGSAADRFVEQNIATNTDTLLTVPLIGWTPKSREYACGFSVQTYGAQADVDPWRNDCGNGLEPDWTTPIVGNDPTDTSLAIDPTFVQGWMNHLIGNYGDAQNGGVHFYALDNEPMLWDSTHRDVHPDPTSYDEMRDQTYAYAAAIKATDPAAQTTGPVVYGYTAYFYSALDWAPGGAWWNNPLDRLAHGNVPFVEWYLQQMAAYESAHEQRILDYVDIHYYPASDGVTLSGAGDANTQALRLRSTRSLWDPTYTDESWIGDSGYPPVRLIPMMHDWVENNYPGTKLAITEYNWGAYDHINGALAEADVLGIFGREGLDLATLWVAPEFTDPVAFAFRMYRNYDGNGRSFGDQSLLASSSDQEQLAVYAAQRSSDGAITVVVINKTGGDLTSNLSLTGVNLPATAVVYRYSPANLAAITHEPDQPVTGNGFTATYPANSITLLEFPSSFEATHFLNLPVIIK